MVVQVRGLDTGRSRDVGGVVRICRGGIGPEEETEDDEEKEVEEVRGEEKATAAQNQRERGSGEERWEEGEWLWEVKRDGGLRVWERGS